MFYLGIVTNQGRLHVAVLKADKEGPKVDSLENFLLGDETVKLFYNLPAFQSKQEVSVVSGLEADSLFMRKLNLPISGKRKILEALPFQLESLIPFQKEPLVALQLQPLGPQMSSVTILATQPSSLQYHLQHFSSFELQVDHVSCVPAALARFVTWQFPQESKVLCLDVKGDLISCVLVDRGELIVSQTLRRGSETTLLAFLQQKGVADDTTPWLVTGDALALRLPGRELVLTDPQHKMFAIPIGLALDALRGDRLTIQFCQKEFVCARLVKAQKKKALFYAGYCATAALALFLCGSWMLHKKQKGLAKQLKPHVSSTLALDSVEQMQEAIATWEGTLKGEKQAFMMVPNVARVSDLLAYLSSHPALNPEGGGIEIQSIRYTLSKYPKINDPSALYTAQVHLELVTSTPHAAREFHESLLKGDALVNSKKEIKWHTHRNTHQVSFELNRGVVP